MKQVLGTTSRRCIAGEPCDVAPAASVMNLARPRAHDTWLRTRTAGHLHAELCKFVVCTSRTRTTGVKDSYNEPNDLSKDTMVTASEQCAKHKGACGHGYPPWIQLDISEIELPHTSSLAQPSYIPETFLRVLYCRVLRCASFVCNTHFRGCPRHIIANISLHHVIWCYHM